MYMYICLQSTIYYYYYYLFQITTATYMLYLNHDEEFLYHNICLLLKCY